MNERDEQAIIDAINQGKTLYLREQELDDSEPVITPVRVMKHPYEYKDQYQPIVAVVIESQNQKIYYARFNHLFLTESAAKENKRSNN